ncbi:MULTISPECIES: GYD domain-containing protein [Desulfococcus]|jgi:uncharacterized protein with GYD domain|uniref:GYD family protein n=1 Tax=Desulfococcus multivorans DSM 2059 TaxID=1121405 RepID=S7U3X7_DESML|nr:GYD domain-containing protein [Desulfococcus multivorans]AOY57653.1 conserved uncharacterized protein [Desulfococcus multivorans]AQV00057.1 GYD family protein [Desulfococcus multivorans]EPR44171.1 hypothetical protein dsmv_1121 [Desulfococcus multivorans DSM 2059]MDX9818463.1 GYD domain-containing protein [Desulfococcus multivorans]SJZ78056.1 GYD domain-containing protein [Desulfococcus multivorans DSM 2059]
MSEFVMLTRLSANAVHLPMALEELEKKIMAQIRSECPRVEWLHSYAILGPYDYMDIFRAPDDADAFKVATIIRSYGYAHTEIWGAKEWQAFKALIRDLSREQ